MKNNLFIPEGICIESIYLDSISPDGSMCLSYVCMCIENELDHEDVLNDLTHSCVKYKIEKDQKSFVQFKYKKKTTTYSII
jgi:hypothetical protein